MTLKRCTRPVGDTSFNNSAARRVGSEAVVSLCIPEPCVCMCVRESGSDRVQVDLLINLILNHHTHTHTWPLKWQQTNTQWTHAYAFMHKQGYCVPLVHNKMHTHAFIQAIPPLTYASAQIDVCLAKQRCTEVWAPVGSIELLLPLLFSLSLFLQMHSLFRSLCPLSVTDEKLPLSPLCVFLSLSPTGVQLPLVSGTSCTWGIDMDYCPVRSLVSQEVVF